MGSESELSTLSKFWGPPPVTLIADDVGLGKTISAGLVVSELISRSRISKILIVCPKLLCPQWHEEFLNKFDISSEIATGRDLIKADPEDTGAIITTYQSARLYLELIPQDRFQMLILDEAHKLRNLYGVPDPPKTAKCFKRALEERRFRYVLMLTATPIHNRLWDLYSLVDLLTVARGHQNPFGTEGMFARKFIADDRDQARQLKAEARDEFRSIVYSYMSRVRRGDAKLYFPDRVVQMHRVEPTKAELQLISAIAKPIQKLNRLAQISILQALTSSPEALMAQLNNMAKNGTIPGELATIVRNIVSGMPTSAKLDGLNGLIGRLKKENPERWRLIVFTGRLETQTTIQAFLEKHGLRVGIINGASGARNQETLSHFRANPPKYHVIVSTEAGSEGINLQVANVLVNYDLPWNPMIVEQRIGRIQRLASEHASVGIFNIMLQGTFEEYIVGRLMEKLQMASHAIGDIEALLDASGISGEDENGTVSFDEKIRQLVIAALAGKDVEAETRQAEQSIIEAKNTLDRESKNINEMLGGMDGVEYVGPRAPSLPPVCRSMNAKEFTLSALKILGAKIKQESDDLYRVEGNDGREFIRFEQPEKTGFKSRLYAPGTPFFLRLVDRVIATGIHKLEDLDDRPLNKCKDVSQEWLHSFGGIPTSLAVTNIKCCFEGKAVARVRATVAHDSYERLVEIDCQPEEHNIKTDQSGLQPIPAVVESPARFGISLGSIAERAIREEAISEFSRFYLERRSQEAQAAKGDERKSKKLEDEFTPRIDITLVALEGYVYRQIKIRIKFNLDDGLGYESEVTITPHTRQVSGQPEFGICSRSGKKFPVSCLGKCAVTGERALRHLMVCSEASSRLALPEFMVVCSLTGKRVLQDEVERSAISGRLVLREYLKTSNMSGKRAEPEHFGTCDITKTEVLTSELAISEISGKRYRTDQQLRSTFSGKTGHQQEFIICHVTHQPLSFSEAEQCELTGNYVKPGILEECEVTHKRVMPHELMRCSATGKKALKRLFVASSISETPILEQVALRSAMGKFCLPIEGKECFWSGRKVHPEDLRTCELTGLHMHFGFMTDNTHPRLEVLVDLLQGSKREDKFPLWDSLKPKFAKTIGKGRCHIESAALSPNRRHLAVCCEVRTFLGIKVQHAGLIYCVADNTLAGKVALGKRNSETWIHLQSK